jgi:hypothetical protein
VNGPAIDDLVDEFDFGHREADQDWPAETSWVTPLATR